MTTATKGAALPPCLRRFTPSAVDDGGAHTGTVMPRTGPKRSGRRQHAGRRQTAGLAPGEGLALLHGVVTDDAASGLVALQRVVVMLRAKGGRAGAGAWVHAAARGAKS